MFSSAVSSCFSVYGNSSYSQGLTASASFLCLVISACVASMASRVMFELTSFVVFFIPCVAVFWKVSSSLSIFSAVVYG